jgi:hypothetical protein
MINWNLLELAKIEWCQNTYKVNKQTRILTLKKYLALFTSQCV